MLGKVCPLFPTENLFYFLKQSIQVNREKQPPLPMGKGQTIRHLRHHSYPCLRTKIALGFFEHGFEPQTTNAQESFLPSVFTVNLLAMPVMDTAPSQMSNPPYSQIDDKKPEVQVCSVFKATTFNKASSTLEILKEGLDLHPFCILYHAFM